MSDDIVTYVSTLPAEQQVGREYVVVLRLGERVLDLLSVVTKAHERLCKFRILT